MMASSLGMIFAAIGASVAGLAGGWIGRGRVSAWCTRCGHPVGTTCAACRDVRPAAPRTHAAEGGSA